jgi:hypothetical protein
MVEMGHVEGEGPVGTQAQQAVEQHDRVGPARNRNDHALARFEQPVRHDGSPDSRKHAIPHAFPSS